MWDAVRDLLCRQAPTPAIVALFGALGLTLCSVVDPASAQLSTRPLAPGKVADVEGQKALFVVAHRGGAGLFPENTAAAVRHSLALGVDGVEIDVQLTADGQVVAYHDLELNPDTTQAPYDEWLVKPGPAVKDLTYPELRVYDVGGVNPRSDYALRYPAQKRVEEEPIPLLADIVRTIKENGRGDERLWVEIKTDPTRPELSAPSKATAEAVVAVLKAEEFLDRSDIMSFDWTALETVKRLHPISRRIYLTMEPKWLQDDARAMSAQDARKILWGGLDLAAFDGSLPRAAAARGGLVWAAFHGDLTAGAVSEAERLGLAVAAWTVNEPGRLRQMIALGVDFIARRGDGVVESLVLARKIARRDGPPRDADVIRVDHATGHDCHAGRYRDAFFDLHESPEKSKRREWPRASSLQSMGLKLFIVQRPWPV